MGQHTTGHTSITSQAVKPFPHPLTGITPPPIPIPPPNSSLPFQGGGHMYTSLVSIKQGVPKPATSLHPLPSFPLFLTQQCHLGMFASFLFQSNISLRPDEVALV